MIRLQTTDRFSPNHGPRPEPARIDMLVLHYTGMTTAAAALERLCDPEARVSAHYVVEENGVIWRLVPENRRAFHAGVSCWEGESDLNAVSVGIEIVNPGHEWGYRPFPEAQMASVEALCAGPDLAPFDPAAPGGRSFGHCAGPQERSRRVVRLAQPRPRRHRDMATGKAAASPGSRSIPPSAIVDLSAIGYCADAESQTPGARCFSTPLPTRAAATVGSTPRPPPASRK